MGQSWPTAFMPPLAYEFVVVRRLAAEQGVLLSNRSSVGFETSAGVSRHSSEQQTERLDFSMILRSSTQPGLRHAVCRRSFYPPLSPLYPLLWLSLFLLVVERNH